MSNIYKKWRVPTQFKLPNKYPLKIIAAYINIAEIGLSKQIPNNPQKSGSRSHGEVGISVPNSSLLVPLGKSKKLAALRKQTQSPQTIEKNPEHRDEIPASGLNKEVGGLLKAAREQINAKIDEIMASYPPGKQNKMFALKYGSPESIKHMTMKAIFTRLNMVKSKNFALIENLDYFGNDSKVNKPPPPR